MNELNNPIQDRTDLTDLKTIIEQIRHKIGEHIIGQQHMVNLIIAGILADGHILIEGVPGIAKTLAAKLVAKSINARFSRIQFTPDLMPSDVLGTSIYNMQKSAFEFKRGPVFANIVLIDEINRAPAKTQSALFEVMEERQATIDGVSYPLDAPFIVLATQNPIEQEGTYRLPEAQLDRFLMKIEITYPSHTEEVEILKMHHQRKGQKAIDLMTPYLNANQISHLRELVQNILIDDKLIDYLARIVLRTRNHPALYLGASPRASIALMNVSKALAAIAGRDFVLPEDIQTAVKPVLGHRIQITPEKEMEGKTSAEILHEIVAGIEVPR